MFRAHSLEEHFEPCTLTTLNVCMFFLSVNWRASETLSGGVQIQAGAVYICVCMEVHVALIQLLKSDKVKK